MNTKYLVQLHLLDSKLYLNYSNLNDKYIMFTHVEMIDCSKTEGYYVPTYLVIHWHWTELKRKLFCTNNLDKDTL